MGAGRDSSYSGARRGIGTSRGIEASRKYRGCRVPFGGFRGIRGCMGCQGCIGG